MKQIRLNRAQALESLKAISTESIDAHRQFASQSLEKVADVASLFVDTLSAGHKILIFGNGGSAADAQHVAGELVGRFLQESEPWPVIALTTDTSVITCIGNDWDYSQIYSRQVRALAREGDLVVGISTSGDSPNIIKGLEEACKQKARTIAFTGMRGTRLAELVDICFVAPSHHTPRVQEIHLLAWHGVCELVEDHLLKFGTNRTTEQVADLSNVTLI